MDYIYIAAIMGILALGVYVVVGYFRRDGGGTVTKTAYRLHQIQTAKDLIRIELCALSAQEAIIKALVDTECEEMDSHAVFGNDRFNLSFTEEAQHKAEQKCYDFDNKSNLM